MIAMGANEIGCVFSASSTCLGFNMEASPLQTWMQIPAFLCVFRYNSVGSKSNNALLTLLKNWLWIWFFNWKKQLVLKWGDLSFVHVLVDIDPLRGLLHVCWAGTRTVGHISINNFLHLPGTCRITYIAIVLCCVGRCWDLSSILPLTQICMTCKETGNVSTDTGRGNTLLS